MNKQRIDFLKIKGSIFRFLFCLAAACVILMSDGITSYAQAAAEVKIGEGRIRESADKTSKTLASVKKGDKLDVLSETKDKEGYTWYKVRINAEDTGYIRADLVTVSGSVPTEKTSSSSDKTNTSSQSSSAQQTNKVTTEVVAVTVTETDVLSVKSTTSANIRKGAGTKFASAGGVKEGVTMAVSGVAADSDGKNWYQVSLSENSQTITGFIREDLVEIVEQKAEEIPVEETVPEEEIVQQEEENKDYELNYMANNSGEMDWFLFNNIEGTSMSLTQMLSVIDQVKNKELKEAEEISNMRLIIIIMAVVIAVLIAVAVYLVFRLRYDYEEYEEEEEEEEEEEVISAPKTRKITLPLGGKRQEKEEQETSLQDASKAEENRETEKERKRPLADQPAAGESVTMSESRAWQSKDFLELDDDMEFEFLDL